MNIGGFTTGHEGYTLTSYGLYLVISVVMTIWVARTLHKGGRAFLVRSFHGDEVMADSVNHLLVVGFYLVSLGFIGVSLVTAGETRTTIEALLFVSTRVGAALLALGALHMLNVYALDRLRKRAIEDERAGLAARA